MSMDSAIQIHNDGLGEEAVESLAEVFARHVEASPGGMAFTVYRRGEPLARFYGGKTVRDGSEPGSGLPTPAPWAPETMAVLFSGTKGIVATVAAILMDRGELKPETRVCQVWPEFAAAGKADVTVAHVFSHTAGLLYLDPEPDFDPLLEASEAAEILARQQPLWQPGTQVAYHALTFGMLAGEIIRRTVGKTVHELVSDLLAVPHGLDIYLGLPESLDYRVATVGRSEGYRISTFLNDPQRRRIVDRMYGDRLTGPQVPFNSPNMRRAGHPAGGGIGSSDAMAKLYSLLADPTAPIVSSEALQQATRTWSEGVDVVNDRPLRFGLGFELADPMGTYGPICPAFGHTGAGGGLHGAWPQKDIGFSFLTNDMQSEDVDTRARDLVTVLAGLSNS